MNLFDSKKKLGIAGVIMGLVAATLAYFGNPANMAICIACFVRDTAGALGLHSAEPVQYARPEIIGIVLGAFIISIATKEYRATAGSSTIVRFVLYDTVSQSHKSALSVSAAQLVCSIRPAGCNSILFSMCYSLISPERERIKSVILKES